ncbi:RICIN domain-containing protein [Noviherbaspirillum sedimenti]|uniref:Ricin B lectin domain-containing protein n=1 Tax=Noviherbaspirillum sedimenti TaxID=2320865 RepID=A0A3A3GJE3_9BURK|nr:RICIN domain-containing protein [Noviherbaspirillum sedimenti]RJG01070.1 hypothetical protein D3878_05290 [Noviherbaspirillum sedimenti]
MHNFRAIPGQAIALTASLFLVAACGGGSDGGPAPAATAGSSSTAAATSTTNATTTSTSESATTTTSSTTTTQAPPFNFAAATLTIQHSGFCLGVSDDVVGSNARQLACVGGDALQSWEIKSAGTDYTIRNFQSNLCLLVNDAVLPVDRPSYVVQGTCDGSANTLWNFQQTATPGNLNVVAKHSGLCMDVIASDLTPGKEIIQYTCNSVAGQMNQQLKITAITP